MKTLSIFRMFMDEKNVTDTKNKTEKLNFEKKPINKKNSFFYSDFNNYGLATSEADKLLKKCGENKLVSQKKVSAVRIFAGQFKDFLVLILLISAAISIFVGEITEAIFISTILFLNAVMGFIQEFKTEKTLEALDNMITPFAKVYRDGELCKIPANLIVPGDIIVVESGDTVVADSIILNSKRLELDESILTGESVSVNKEADFSLDETNSLNKKNVLYMGTSIVKGYGMAKVVATGMKTQMGQIAGMIEKINESETPLQKRLDQIGKFIIAGCLIISGIVIFIGIFRGEDPFEMLIAGLSLAVASVPEGLPAIVTIALAFAVKHMVKRKALVRRLHAVETLGCANLICTDKTGTITQNEMTVKNIITIENCFEVSGDGFENKGEIFANGKKIILENNSSLKMLLEVSVVCNSSEIVNISEKNAKFYGNVSCSAGCFWKPVGEPTEVALLIAAAKTGIFKEEVLKKYNIYDIVPFDSLRKYMTTFVISDDGKKYIFVKGAYEIFCKKCRFCKKNGRNIDFSRVVSFFDEKTENLARSGMRLIAFAYKEILNFEDDENLIFLGFAAMYDPPRQEARAAVSLCRNAGIKTVMITGDSKFTAISVAKKVGIFRSCDRCIEGKELDAIDDSRLNEIVKNVTVFARVSPNHKLRIVNVFKKQGNIVAMTGDGVNDAPAIKEADIGVSMGKNGSDVSKQAADLVLLDDNFATLVSAVEEGRIIYGNIRKFMRYLLSCNIGEILTTLFAMLIGMPLPLLPMQILLINLVTDGLPAVALGLEPAEGRVMQNPPRSSKESIFSKGLMMRILTRGILISLTSLTAFTLIFRMTLSINIARTATFLTLVSLQLIHVFECKSETNSIFRINHLNNKKLIFATTISFLIAIMSVWFRPFSRIVKNYPLNFKQTFVIVILSLTVPIINAIAIGINNMFKRRKDSEKNIEIPINCWKF